MTTKSRQSQWELFRTLSNRFLQITEEENFLSSYRIFFEEVNKIATWQLLPDKLIDNWLSPKYFQWIGETPPLDWFASAVSLFLLQKSLPEVSAIRLLQAANYFGVSSLVISLSECFPNATNNFLYSIFKQRAKAFKNSGDYETACTEYRQALKIAFINNDNIHIAYFLLLFAQLCDHYQQRLGWHRSFHFIAQNRLNLLQKKDTHIKRWLQISRDSIARIIYEENPIKAETLFKKSYNAVNHNLDARIRVQSHQLEAQLLFLIKKAASSLEFEQIDQKILEFRKLIHETLKLANNRSLNARRLELVKITRKIFIKKKVLDRDLQVPAINLLIEGEADVMLKAVIEHSKKFNDQRMLASAYIEKVRWNLDISKEINNANTTFSERLCDESRESLLHVRSILGDSKYWNSTAYYESLYELGKIEFNAKNFEEAYQYFDEAYEYCKSLLHNVQDDERLLSMLPNNEVISPTSPHFKLQTEIAILSSKEREKLSSGMHIDYRDLLHRSIKIGEKLRMIQTRMISKRKMQAMEVWTEISQHSVVLRLRSIADGAKEVPSTYNRINELINLIETWREVPAAEFYHLELLDICISIEQYIKKSDFCRYLVGESQLDFQRSLGKINLDKLQNRSVNILLNQHILALILENLIDNVYESALRNKINNFSISFDIIEKSNIAFLVVEDNTGSYNELRTAVDLLNNRQYSFKGKRGQGLKTVRNVIAFATGLDFPWQVDKIDDFDKTIIIPIGTIQA